MKNTRTAVENYEARSKEAAQGHSAEAFDGHPLAQGQYVHTDGRVYFSGLLYWRQEAASRKVY